MWADFSKKIKMQIKTNLLILIVSFLFFSCENTPQPSAPTPPTKEELKTMIGQMIMIGCRGKTPEQVSPKIIDHIEKGNVGGIILFDYDVIKKAFDRNIESPEQVKTLVQHLHSKSKTPLMMAVDQEGGVVNRLKPKYGFPRSVSAKYLGDLNNIDSTKFYATLNATTLSDLGFNVNFSPVVDIDLNPNNPVIGKYERSYSNNVNTIVTHASAWIKKHADQGILSTLKHFPGHGSSDADSHEGFTDVTKQWKEIELEPFKKVLQTNPSTAVMTAHVFNSQLDSIYPATLSEKVIDDILRKDFQFDGIIFSDDLQMKAVHQLFDFQTIIKRSLIAGVDILVFGNNLEYDEDIPNRVIETVLKLIDEGEISTERIEQSYKRILKQKELF